MAGTTGLEPATSAVTGQRSDQLSYVPSANPIALRKLQNLLSSYCPRLRQFPSFPPNLTEFRLKWTVWKVCFFQFPALYHAKANHEVVTTPLGKLYQTNLLAGIPVAETRARIQWELGPRGSSLPKSPPRAKYGRIGFLTIGYRVAAQICTLFIREGKRIAEDRRA
jgi:hypothetical protein